MKDLRRDWRRREFLRWSAASSGGIALALTGCGSSAGNPLQGPDSGGASDGGGADGGGGKDAAPGCSPTQNDALGPFFEEGAPMRAQIADEAEPGERLELSGRIVMADCETPLAGVLVDIWQADKDGAYHDADADYRLRGQVTSDADGRFEIQTIRPGNYENTPGGWRPAHLHFKFNKAGFSPIVTQLYFAGDPYLSPNDNCGSCGSDDPDRIVELSGDPDAGYAGSFRVVMASG